MGWCTSMEHGHPSHAHIDTTPDCHLHTHWVKLKPKFHAPILHQQTPLHILKDVVKLSIHPSRHPSIQVPRPGRRRWKRRRTNGSSNNSSRASNPVVEPVHSHRFLKVLFCVQMFWLWRSVYSIAAISFFKSGSSDRNPTAVEYILWSVPSW